MKVEIGTKNKTNILIDKEDYERLIGNGWSLSLTEHGYIFCNKYLGKKDGKYKYERKYLHALIMGTPKGLFTDHINGNRLDNRKKNLRICSAGQNTYNMKSNHGTSSSHKGVYKHSVNNRWIAQIRKAGKTEYLGSFKTEKEAALTYNRRAVELHGDFARLNKI